MNDSNCRTIWVIVNVLRRGISDAVAPLMVDSPIYLWVFVVSTAAIRARLCRLGRSEKERFDIAFSARFQKNELRLPQLTRVMYAV